MSKCTWDPSKHGGQQCPVHGAGGADADYKEGSKRISGGKYQISKDRKNYEDVDRERYSSLDIDEEAMDETLDNQGVIDDLNKVGFDDIEVVDNKTLKFRGPDNQEGWMIKENEDLGFDVYDSEGKKVINDINANRDNVATKILQYEQNKGNKIDVEDFDAEDDSDITQEDKYNPQGSAFKNKKKMTEEEFKDFMKKHEGDYKFYDDSERVDDEDQKLTVIYDNGKHIGTYNKTTGEFFNDEDDDKLSKGNPYDPEKLQDEGMSQEELDEKINDMKYVRYPDNSIKFGDEYYADEKQLEEAAGRGALNHIREANEEEVNKFEINKDELNHLSNILKEHNVTIKPTPKWMSKYHIESNHLPYSKREEIINKLEKIGYEVQGDGKGNLDIYNSLNENQYNSKKNDYIIQDFLEQYGYREKLSPEEKAVIAKILRLK